MVTRDLREKGELIAVIIAAVALAPALRLVLTRHREQICKRMTEENGIPEEKVELLLLVIDGALVGTYLYKPEQRAKRTGATIQALHSILDVTPG